MTRELKVAKAWHKEYRKVFPIKTVKSVYHTGCNKQLKDCVAK
jgi:hypothetical protein